MIIILGCPAYRQQINVRTATCVTQDALWAQSQGWQAAPLWVDVSGIARARNQLVREAERCGARLLLMCDSDTFALPPQGGLERMWETMVNHKAAVVGAAVPTRNGQRMNCEPAKPGETYEGEVGTGYMLLDLVKLRDLPKPWFVHEDTDDGLKVQCGEDIYFCRHAKAHGHSVIVDFGLAMGHADQSISATGGDDVRVSP
jgi:hypothetical protein